jgi:hypothetical protein
VKCVKPGDQCLSIEVKNYTDDCVVEDVILLLGDEVNKVNFCQSMQASKHPELLLKEYIDRGVLHFNWWQRFFTTTLFKDLHVFFSFN